MLPLHYTSKKSHLRGPLSRSAGLLRHKKVLWRGRADCYSTDEIGCRYLNRTDIFRARIWHNSLYTKRQWTGPVSNLRTSGPETPSNIGWACHPNSTPMELPNGLSPINLVRIFKPAMHCRRKSFFSVYFADTHKLCLKFAVWFQGPSKLGSGFLVWWPYCKPLLWSGWEDSNLRYLGPKPSAIATRRHPDKW